MSEKAQIAITIEHQQDKQRFVIPVDGHEAVLEYRLDGKHINFCRTYVPD
ncbi:MAG: GNAT family N-acetyltransferase, partial [Shewanella sp.]